MGVEWPTAKIGDVCLRVTKGTTPTTGGGAFSDRGIAFIKVEAITESGGFLPEKFAYIDTETDERLARSRLKEHDILFTIAGTIGRVAQVTSDVLPANTNQAVAIIRPNRDVIYPRFLYYALRDSNRIQLAQSKVVQSVQANFSLGELSAIELPLPPQAEQRAIAHILGTLDDKIELNRRRNETLGAMAHTLFQDWFVDFGPVRAKLDGRAPYLPPGLWNRFPDRLDNGGKPEGWEVKPLLDLTTLITKGTTPTKENMNSAPESDAQITYVRVNSIDEKGFVIDANLTSIPKSVHAGVLKRSILKSNDILYTIAGTIGRMAVVEEWLLPANTNQAVAIIRPQPTIPVGFLIQTLRQEGFREELHNSIVQAVQANLSLGTLAKARVIVPPEHTLAKIFSPIDNIFSMISANRGQSRTLAQLRDTLLPKLISGELRIAGAEKLMERTGI